jgi:AcrR family transcriptional regulator
VAARLFAERGIEHVAVRDITDATGTNIAAINYHFGSKHGLIEALVDRGAGEFARRRGLYLDALEDDGSTDLRMIVEALVVPTAEMVRTTADSRYYAQFLGRLATHPEFMPLVNKAYDRHTNRFLALLEQATPDLDPNTRLLRFVAAKELVNQFVGEPTGRILSWLSSRAEIGFEQIVQALVDMIVGLLSAPVSSGNPSSSALSELLSSGPEQ